jgi:drug/metabolite transporter (DMT)-like permease
MIQRQQTLWLLLSTIAGVFTFMFPFATGEKLVKTGLREAAQLNAGNNFFILLLTIASIGIASVAIFMYKDRKLQIKLCLLGFLVSAITIVLYFMAMKKMLSSTPALWVILPVAVITGYFMAFRNIRKDEKLVKSLDKLR